MSEATDLVDRQISGFNLAGFPPAFTAAVVYRIRDGLIRDVVFLL